MISKFFINRPIFATVIAIVMVLVGLVTIYTLPVAQFPDITPPTVQVTAVYPGASAETVAKTVGVPIEEQVNGVDGMIYMSSSSSSSGQYTLTVTFEVGTDIDMATVLVQNRVNIAQGNLPEAVIQQGIITKKQSTNIVMFLALESDNPLYNSLYLSNYAKLNITDELSRLPGVGGVTVFGADNYSMRIWLDPELMRIRSLTPADVYSAIQAQNMEVSAGSVGQPPTDTDEAFQFTLVSKGRLSTPEEFGRIIIKSLPGGEYLRLRDIATIDLGSATYNTTSTINGKETAAIAIYQLPGSNSLDVAKAVKAKMMDLSRYFPNDVQYKVVLDTTQFVSASIDEVLVTFVETSLIVMLVILIFLQNFRAMIIPSLTIPVSLIATFAVMKLMGFSINTLTLFGLVLAIAIVVDDAIVDVENVYKRLRENRMKPKEEQLSVLDVVFNASKEVRMPILNSTLIIVVSFVPLFFLTGMEGRMLVPLGIAFIVALFASTVVALTLTPVLCSYLLGRNKSDKLPKEAFVARWLKGVYEKALVWVLNHKRITLGSTIALFIIVLGCFFTLGRSFLPPFNEGSFTINISSLPGISLEESDKMGHRAEMLLLSIPEIQTVARKTGRAELDEHALGVNTSEIEAPFELKDRSRSELVADVREKLGTITGANIEIGQPISHRIDAMLSGTKANIAIKLFGDDLNKMFSLGNEIKSAIEGIPGIADLNVEQQIERPQLKITPKREMLAKYGITLPEFSEYINVALAGEVISQVYEKGKAFDLIIKVKNNFRDEAEKIRNLMVDTSDGKKVPLSYVADVVSAMGPNTINRENVKRKIVISANVADRDLRSVVNDIQNKIDSSVQLPEGYHIEYGGHNIKRH